MSDIIKKTADFLSRFSFDSLLWFCWGSFLIGYALCLIAVFAVPGARTASKKPVLCLVNCYSVLTLELFLTASDVPLSLFAAGVFWLTGYLLYGLLCALSRALARPAARASAPAVSPPPRAEVPLYRPAAGDKLSGTPSNGVVRMDHAIGVCEKLLGKNLGRTDRQQVEKLKSTLEVLRVKGTLTPPEGEILNDNFNALLKLMAKYDV